MFQSHAIGEIGGVAGVGDEGLAFLDEKVHQVVRNGPVGVRIGQFLQQHLQSFFKVIGVYLISNGHGEIGKIAIIAALIFRIKERPLPHEGVNF